MPDSNTQNTSLLDIVSKRDIDTLKSIISEPDSCLDDDIDKLERCLMEAVSSNWVQGIDTLVNSGLNLNFISRDYLCSPLARAIELGYPDLAIHLLHCGANPNVGSIDFSILQAAISMENIELVTCLLDSGCSANGSFESGTPLTVAASIGNLPIIKLLINFGASVNYVDRDTLPALRFAASAGHIDVFNYLRPLTCDPQQVRLSEQELEYGVICKSRRENQLLRQFKEAVIEQDIHVIRSIVSAGLDINTFDDAGEAALHICAKHGLTDSAHCLIVMNANVNLRSELTHNSPLDYAIISDKVSMADLLINVSSG